MPRTVHRSKSKARAFDQVIANRWLDDAVRNATTIEDWCRDADVRLERLNGDLHWKFHHDLGLVEWWPSTARLVDDGRYDRPSRAESWKHLLTHLVERFW